MLFACSCGVVRASVVGCGRGVVRSVALPGVVRPALCLPGWNGLQLAGRLSNVSTPSLGIIDIDQGSSRSDGVKKFRQGMGTYQDKRDLVAQMATTSTEGHSGQVPKWDIMREGAGQTG